MDSIEQLRWKVQLRIRTLKKRRRDASGRARGFYEGKYVYVRVTDPHGRRREIYLGAGDHLVENAGPRGVERAAPASSSSSSRRGVERGGGKGRIMPLSEAPCETCGGTDGMKPGNPFCSYCCEDEEFSGVAIAKARRRR